MVFCGFLIADLYIVCAIEIPQSKSEIRCVTWQFLLIRSVETSLWLANAERQFQIQIQIQCQLQLISGSFESSRVASIEQAPPDAIV